MRSIGAIVVGIATYRGDPTQFTPLRYASADADEIVRYLTTCWPKREEATLIHLANHNATLDAVAAAFMTLAQDGPYELQFVFMSGHGSADGDGAGFLLQPLAGASDVTILRPDRLDRLLEMASAKQTLFILDCCYAEGITRRMRFFSALGDSDARLFVASSRETQRTWEDDRIGHGVFTAHLLDLLRTGSSAALNGIRDRLDVDGELFRVVCDQVPLYVLEHQHQQQEPVKGGVSIRPVRLPVARSQRRIKERTAFTAAVRRVRQIAAGTAVACLTFLVFAYVLTYYAQADRNGRIHLYHGMRWTAALFRFLPSLRSDTGISWTELSDEPAQRYAVQAGDVWGFWTQVSRRGYRAWYDGVRPGLDPQAAARYDVLLAAGGPSPVSRLSDDSRPSEVAFAAWALLADTDANQLQTLFRHLLGADRIEPMLKPFAANDLDFNILDLLQSQLASYAEALRAAAAIDPDRTFVPYLGFLKANQIWLAHSSPEQHGREAQRRAADDVADVLAVIVRARMDRGRPALDPQQIALLNDLADVGYGGLVRLALSRLSAAPDDGHADAARALAAFHGDANEAAEADALRRLKGLLDSSAVSRAMVEKAYEAFVAAGGLEQSDLTAFLIAAADRKALPPSLVTILLKAAQEAVDRSEGVFMDSEYARILAHAMTQVPDASRPLVYRLIERVTASTTPKASSTAEMYTALARQGLDTPAMFQQVVTIAGAAPSYQAQSPDLVAEPLPGMSIVVGYGPWLEALAVIATQRGVPPNAIEILERHAVDPTHREVIVRALVRQPGQHGQRCWQTSCGQILKAFPTDGARRQLAADVLSERLANLPRNEFLIALEKLRQEQLAESEPEIRIALGLAAVNAQLARVRTVVTSRALFQSQ